MDRSEWLLAGLNHESKLIEIGASFNPLAPRSEGWKTTVVDHVSRDGLLEKYSVSPELFSSIESVDVVISGNGALESFFPPEDINSFDAVIGSHIIEHIPNPIGFFQSCGKLLKNGGALRMAVPDKRRGFDFFRPFTTTAQLIEAHEAGATIHSARTAFEAVAYTVFNDGAAAWGEAPHGEISFAHSLDMARACFVRSSHQPTYFDFHAWCFSPASFSLIILELHHLSLIDFSIDEITDTLGSEFLVLMRSECKKMDEDELNIQRLKLLKNIMLDNNEQIKKITEKSL